jgi:release factor glutamine methyltransferase
MNTIRDLFFPSIEFLEKKGIPNARRSVEALLSIVLKKKRLEIYLSFDTPIEPNELKLYKDYLKQRASRKPIAYIEQQVEFLGSLLFVDSSVLIPRQETEQLAQMVIESAPKGPGVVFDVCTGSGCLAIAIKKHCPHLTLFASDLSKEALETAKKNASLNKVDITFLHGDLLLPFQGKQCDLFVCNPPYIALDQKHLLEPEVALFEPPIALFGGDDGNEFYKRLGQDLHLHLKPHAKAFLELGQDQETISKYFNPSFFKTMEIKKDLSHKNRFFFLERESPQV